MTRKGIYVHIPFCPYKCNYCDFLTFSNVDKMINPYVETLIKEIALYKKINSDSSIIDSIFIGGGTPSYIEAKYISLILTEIKKIFDLTYDCEITIEMNPNTLNEEKIRSYLNSGINRFSLGVQTFDSSILKILGRDHNKEIVFEEVKMLKKLGAKNISLDMMLANPKQDMEILKSDLDYLLMLEVDHVSYYTLILEEKTLFYHWLNQGKIDLFDSDLERKMFHYVDDKLKANGFNKYEISNFSKANKESRHNKKYWQQEEFIGFGLGATGMEGQVRYKNHLTFTSYFEAIEKGELPRLEQEELTLEDLEKEYIIMGMRKTQGISIEHFNQKFNVDLLEKYSQVIDKHIKYNTIEIVDGFLRFTSYGFDICNQFYIDII